MSVGLRITAEWSSATPASLEIQVPCHCCRQRLIPSTCTITTITLLQILRVDDKNGTPSCEMLSVLQEQGKKKMRRLIAFQVSPYPEFSTILHSEQN